jgi:hypothetical protein
VERAVLFLLLELAQPIERSLDRLEVGERAAQPALRDIELPGPRRLLADHVLRLLLGAHEKDLIAARADVDDRLERRAEQLDRVLQVDDVDAVARTEDERLHLRVPAPGVVAEVNPGLEQLPHRDGRAARVLRVCSFHDFSVVPPASSPATGDPKATAGRLESRE